MTSSQNKNLWIAYTDGASRGNPGLAGCGAFIVSPEGEQSGYKVFIGEKTNNQAEYQALILALTELVKAKAVNALVRADSEFMIKQMLGLYRVKNEGIIPLYKKAKELAGSIPNIRFEHVRREFNQDADRLANEAIDERP